MKKKNLLIIILLSVSLFTLGFAVQASQNHFYSSNNLLKVFDRDLKQNCFQRGEYIRYGLYYLGRVGEAEIVVDNKQYFIPHMPQRSCVKVDVKGRTTGLMTLFRVDDLWRSYIDEKSINSIRFYRSIEENKYRRTEQMDFYPESKYAHLSYEQFGVDRNDKTTYSPEDKQGRTEVKLKYVQLADAYSQDLISGYYYLRTMDMSKMAVGQYINIPAAFEEKTYSFNIRFDGPGGAIEVKTPNGRGMVETYKLTPIMTDGLTAEEGQADADSFLFRGSEPLTIWVSADENKIPLRAEARIFLGKVVLELDDYKGLKHPLNLK